VLQLFNKIDQDGNGELTLTEFLRAFKTDDVVVNFCKEHPRLAPLLHPLSFKKAFDGIDKDGNASVTPDELNNAIRKITDEENFEGQQKGDTSPGIALQNKNAFQTEIIRRHALDEKEYTVEDFYLTDGRAQWIARHEYFQNFTLAVIVANALYLGIDAELNDEDALFRAHAFFIIMEFLFCAYFLFEIAVRFGAFQSKFNCFKDNWFKFDTLLVLLMVMETLILSWLMPLVAAGSSAPPTGPLRLLRLLRLSRIVRLLRSFPELATMVKGIQAAVRAVAASLLMIVVMLWVFAIVMKLCLGDSPAGKENFGSLREGLWTLAISGVLLDDIGSVLNNLRLENSFSTAMAVFVFIVFVLLATITVMNMLIGVLCEVVSSVAEEEREEAAISLMKQTVLLELKKFDDGDGMINENELNVLMCDPNAVEVLDAIGIDIPFLQTLQVMMFENPDSEVDIHDILDQMLTCRRDLNCTVKHLILGQHLTIWNVSNKILQHEKRLEKKIAFGMSRLLEELQQTNGLQQTEALTST
jgi:hypothetical protein